MLLKTCSVSSRRAEISGLTTETTVLAADCSQDRFTLLERTPTYRLRTKRINSLLPYRDQVQNSSSTG